MTRLRPIPTMPATFSSRLPRTSRILTYISGRYRFCDEPEHSRQVGQYRRGIDAKDAIASAHQPALSPRISPPTSGMLAAINLDDEIGTGTRLWYYCRAEQGT